MSVQTPGVVGLELCEDVRRAGREPCHKRWHWRMCSITGSIQVTSKGDSRKGRLFWRSHEGQLPPPQSTVSP